MASKQSAFGKFVVCKLVIGSRTSNAEVLSYVHAPKLSCLLLEQQLLVFGKIFRKPSDDVLRSVVFEEESDILKLSTKKRRKGRPKLAWATQVRKVAMMVSTDNLIISLGDEVCWKLMVRKYCRAPCSMPPAA